MCLLASPVIDEDTNIHQHQYLVACKYMQIARKACLVLHGHNITLEHLKYVAQIRLEEYVSRTMKLMKLLPVTVISVKLVW